MARTEDGHILFSISRKTAEPVEKLEIGRASASRRSQAGDGALRWGFLRRQRFQNALKLLDQPAALRDKNHSRDRGQKDFRFGRDQIGAQQEDAARPVFRPRQRG